MDPNPLSNPPVGLLLIGLVGVLLLAGVIYALGVWAVAQFRQGRIRDETDIPFPNEPQSADDRETAEQARARGAAPDMIATEEQLDDLEVGADRKIVPQTPTRAERPVDAADRRKDAHQVDPRATGGASPASGQGEDKAPL